MFTSKLCVFHNPYLTFSSERRWGVLQGCVGTWRATTVSDLQVTWSSVRLSDTHARKKEQQRWQAVVGSSPLQFLSSLYPHIRDPSNIPLPLPHRRAMPHHHHPLTWSPFHPHLPFQYEIFFPIMKPMSWHLNQLDFSAKFPLGTNGPSRDLVGVHRGRLVLED
jgi:hypothetical protein